MATDGISTTGRSHRKRKPARRRARGVQPQERDGYWHAVGRVRINGNSIRVRRSLGLAVRAVSFEEAETECAAYVADIKARVTGTVGRGDPVAIAAHRYLSRKRERPLKPTSINIVKEIVARFGPRRFNEVAAREWKAWIDGEHTEKGFTPGRMTGRSASTRERFLASVLAFLAFAKREHGLAALPTFERDKKARNPNRRARRRVQDFRPELVQLLFDCAHITIRAQLAVEKCTGARVSSVLHAARVCDLHLVPGREQIVFPRTKNGEDVVAVLDASTVAVLKEYLKWRGRLHEREAPLFLTHRRKPYADNGGKAGGQNRTGFEAAKRRAQEALRTSGEQDYKRLMKAGRRRAAEAARAQAEADAALVGKITQHWFRHMLATKLLRHDPRAAMEQGGWLDIRSVIGYSHDAPEYRRELVRSLDWGAEKLPFKRKHGKN